MDDSERPALPPSLRAVAYFTILVGIGTGLTMIVDLFHRNLNFNFAVLLIPAGFGLLRRDRSWRTFTLFMLWFGMIGFAVGFVVLTVQTGKPTAMSGFRPFFREMRPELGAAICAGMFVFELWQYRVLTSPPVRRLFGLTDRGAPPGDRGTGAGPGESASGPLQGT